MKQNGEIPEILTNRVTLISVISTAVLLFVFSHVFILWWLLGRIDLNYPDIWTIVWTYIAASTIFLLSANWLAIKYFALVPLAKSSSALRLSEARLRDIVEAGSDWQWEMDQNLRISYISDKFFERYNVHPEHFIGKTREELACRELIKTKNFKEHIATLQRHLPFRDFIYPIYVDNQKVCYISVNGKPIFDSGGEFIGYRGTTVDITERINAEEKAQSAHRLLVDAIGAFPHGLVIWDKNDRLLLYNNAYRDFFSRGLDIAPGMSFEEIGWLLLKHGRFKIASHQTPIDVMKERLRRHLQASGSFEARLNDGRWVLIYERKTSDGCVIGTYTDITERKYAEAAMNESEKRLQTVLDNAPAIITVKDNNGRYMYINREYGRILGVDTEKLLGKASNIVFPLEYAEKLKANDLRIIEEGKPLQFEEILPIKGKDSTYLSTKVPLYTTSGQLYGICCISTNINDRKALENHLEANVAALRTLHEITSRQYTSFGAKVRALLEFGCRYFGLTHGIMGKTYDGKLEIIESISGNDTIQAGMVFNLSDTYCLETVNSADPFTFAYAGQNAALSLHPCYILFGMESYLGARVILSGKVYGTISFFSRKPKDQPISIADQEIVRLIAQNVGTDMARIRIEDDLRQAKEAAEIADKTKTDFLANMSHELRTPLNAIIGFSEMMHEKILGALGCVAYEGYVKNILDSGRHLLDVINDILDVSKIEAGKLELDETETSLIEIFDICERLNGVRAFEAGITINRQIMPDMPSIIGEPRRIKQIILNLISNAIKFTPRGGDISIIAEVINNGEVHIAVCDTGIGMTADEIEIALKPFGQVESQLSRKYDGTGLGLPLSRSLVELHGGRLSLESTPGQGTCVHIHLPKEKIVA